MQCLQKQPSTTTQDKHCTKITANSSNAGRTRLKTHPWRSDVKFPHWRTVTSHAEMEGPTPLGGKLPQPWQGQWKQPLPQAGTLSFWAATSWGKVPGLMQTLLLTKPWGLSDQGLIQLKTSPSVSASALPCFWRWIKKATRDNVCCHQCRPLLPIKYNLRSHSRLAQPPLLPHWLGTSGVVWQLPLQRAEVSYQQHSNRPSQRKRSLGQEGQNAARQPGLRETG